jgi:Predicted AAA-ATPase/PD-(D/E)XK nuclease superfamily
MSNSNIRLPLGISNFRRIREEGYYFVDKSLLIRDIIDDSAPVILILRPRRFGKTLNLSMLYYYFTNNAKEQIPGLFAGLAIMTAGNYRPHQGHYPVIFLSLKGVKALVYTDALQNIAALVSDLYSKHDYLLENEALKPHEKQIFQRLLEKQATIVEIQNSIKNLLEYLHRLYGIKPILLLDEYDTPIHASFMKNYYEEMVNFMQAFLGAALKDNDHLQKAVITGILRVSQASIFSGLNNIAVYSILKERYSQYFGFLKEEVEQMNQASGNPQSLNAIHEWYNGYQFAKQLLYNPWSIIHCLRPEESGPLQAYWVNIADNSLIQQLITQAKADVKAQFTSLLQGESITQTISEEMVFTDLAHNQADALWNLLLFTGYLTTTTPSTPLPHHTIQLRIPNREVYYLYENIITRWFSDTRSYQDYDELLQSLLEERIATFEKLLQAYINETGSYFDFNTQTSEQVYHALILGLVVGLRKQFVIQSNRESDDGRYDVCLFPKDTNKTGILLEFKKSDNLHDLEKVAQRALEQILEADYISTLRQHKIHDVLILGIAFAAKKVKILSKKISSIS